MKLKILADGANVQDMIQLAADPKIHGFTTNPSLMRKAGVTDYALFAKEVLANISKPVSFEVIADDFSEMERQALLISSWGKNVYVKIPITNTKGEYSTELIYALSQKGVKVNVTAVLTTEQAEKAGYAVRGPGIISIFAGRIMDTGQSARDAFNAARETMHHETELLWASTRELYNIRQAQQVHADYITVPSEILAKMSLLGKDLTEFSLETVKMFAEDAKASGYTL
jgi:transaldolase